MSADSLNSIRRERSRYGHHYEHPPTRGRGIFNPYHGTHIPFRASRPMTRNARGKIVNLTEPSRRAVLGLVFSCSCDTEFLVATVRCVTASQMVTSPTSGDAHGSLLDDDFTRRKVGYQRRLVRVISQEVSSRL